MNRSPILKALSSIRKSGARTLLMGGQACVFYGAAEPQLDPAHLAKGHAVHFRCRRSDVAGLGIDLMSTYRGGPDFQSLWGRRTTIEIAGEPVDLLALEDLVDAKKTQRHNDWPIIARLMERSYFTRNDRAPQALIEFWFRNFARRRCLSSWQHLTPTLPGTRIRSTRPQRGARSGYRKTRAGARGGRTRRTAQRS